MLVILYYHLLRKEGREIPDELHGLRNRLAHAGQVSPDVLNEAVERIVSRDMMVASAA